MRDFSEEDYDCTSYYLEQIPRKLIPLIGMGGRAADRFDAGCLLLHDWDHPAGYRWDHLPSSLSFVKGLGPEAFFARIAQLVGGQSPQSGRTLHEILTDPALLRKFWPT